MDHFNLTFTNTHRFISRFTEQSPGGEFFAVGDTVKIELPVDLVKDMQKDHGNWADGIAQVSNQNEDTFL